ncbi:MAG: DUF1320 domain-containing protein [Actinomycetota bacterium]|nr:DUF1320 domain-containing protein [Actinomycetota bacterium]
MAYATQANIEAHAGGAIRLVELADWDGDGAVDAVAIASVQAESDGWIDGFANVLYHTPIEAPTETLIGHAAAECVFLLKKRRGMATDDDWREHEAREKWLERLAKGFVRPSDPAPAKSDAVRSQTVINNRDVSRMNLKGFT